MASFSNHAHVGPPRRLWAWIISHFGRTEKGLPVARLLLAGLSHNRPAYVSLSGHVGELREGNRGVHLLRRSNPGPVQRARAHRLGINAFLASHVKDEPCLGILCTYIAFYLVVKGSSRQGYLTTPYYVLWSFSRPTCIVTRVQMAAHVRVLLHVRLSWRVSIALVGSFTALLRLTGLLGCRAWRCQCQLWR